MKKIISFISGVALAFGIGAMSAGAQGTVPGLVYNNEAKQIENIQNVNGRVMLPFRAVFEMMGATVDYEDGTRKVTATRGGKVVEFFADGTSIKVTEAGATKEIPAEIGFDYERNRVMVPVRFVSNAMGAQVGWDDSIKTVYVLDTYPLLQAFKTDCPNFIKYLELTAGLDKNVADTAKLSLNIKAPATETAPAVNAVFDVTMNENNFNGTGDANVTLNLKHENLGQFVGTTLGQLENATVDLIKTDSAIYFKTNIFSNISEILPDEKTLHIAENFVNDNTWFRLDYSFIEKEAGKAMADMLFNKSPETIDSVISILETSFAQNTEDVTAEDMISAIVGIDVIKAILNDIELTETDAKNFKVNMTINIEDLINVAMATADQLGEEYFSAEMKNQLADQMRNALKFDMTVASEVVNGVETSENVSLAFSAAGTEINLTAYENSVKLQQAPEITIPANALSISSIMTLLGM